MTPEERQAWYDADWRVLAAGFREASRAGPDPSWDWPKIRVWAGAIVGAWAVVFVFVLSLTWWLS